MSERRGYRRHLFQILFAAVIAAAPQVFAQTVELVPTLSSPAAPLPADNTPTGNGLISQFAPNTDDFQWAVHFSAKGASDDNIGLTHMHRLGDDFLQVEPSVMVGLGDLVKQETFITAAYYPTFVRYDEHPEFDSNQHLAGLLAGIKTPNLTLRVAQDIALMDNIVLAASTNERESLVPTGRTNVDIYNTQLTANYNMSQDDFLFSELVMNRTEYAPPLISFESYTAGLYLNHRFSKQLVLGMGVEGGYNQVDFPTPDQTFVDPVGHLNFTPVKQFSLEIIAGEEFRDFENRTRGTYSTPVFSLTATYQPSESTKIVLTGSRQIRDSASRSAQDYEDNTVNLMIRQRVVKQLYVAVLGGYERVDYFNTIDSPMPTPTLSDDYFYIQPSADILLTRFWSIGGYYLRRQNSGSMPNVEFYSNQAGVRTVIKF